MVGVGYAAGCYVPRFVPSKAFLIHKYTHKFRYSKAGVRIVKLEYYLIGQKPKVFAVSFLEVIYGILKRSAYKEIALLKPERLTLKVVVIGIQYP